MNLRIKVDHILLESDTPSRKVIGGADKGGIIVRSGPGLTDELAKAGLLRLRSGETHRGIRWFLLQRSWGYDHDMIMI